MSNSKNEILIAVLCVVGALLSGALTYVHVRVHLDPTYVSLCAVGASLNCQTVAASTFSTVAGLPLSVIGGVFYLGMAIGSALALKRGTPIFPGVRAVLAAISALLSVGLFILSSAVIGAFCLLCMATYGVNIALAIFLFRGTRRLGGVAAAVVSDGSAFRRSPMAIVQAVVVALLFVVAGPLGGFPRYWEMASWQAGSAVPTGVDAEGRPWLGAEAPSLTIVEFFDFECPACRVSHKKLRKLVGKHRDTVRLVRHDMSRVNCEGKATVRGGRCAIQRAAHCAGQAGRYWDWNDAVIAHPKPLTGPGRAGFEMQLAEALRFDVDAFSSCMNAPSTIDRVVALQKAGKKKRVVHTPTYYVGDQKRVGLKNLMQAIEDKL